MGCMRWKTVLQARQMAPPRRAIMMGHVGMFWSKTRGAEGLVVLVLKVPHSY
jgi:hypothetical protein